MSRRYSDDRTTVILDRSVSQRDVRSEERRQGTSSIVSFDTQLSQCDKVKNGLTIITSYFLVYMTVLVLDWMNGLEMTGVVTDVFDPTMSFPNTIKDYGNNNSTKFHWRKDANETWGVMAIFITFVPGIIYALGNIFAYILGSNSIYHKSEEDEPEMYIIGLKATGLIFLYPFFVCFQLATTILDQKENKFKMVITVIAMAAFLQSAPQLLLQFHTICNGQRPTVIQIVCIFSSFFFLIKTAIEYHIGLIMFYQISFTEKIVKTLKLLPLYMTCLFFRIGTLAIITTHFNWWSIIPLLITIIIVCTIAKKNGHNEIDALLAGPINLFIMAAGMGAGSSEISTQDKKKFYKYSSIAIFILYFIFLVGFLVVWSLIYNMNLKVDENFNIGSWNKKIFYKEDIDSYGMYVIFSAILFSGTLNLTFLFIDTGHELEVLTSKSEVARGQTGRGSNATKATRETMEMNERNNENQEEVSPDQYEYLDYDRGSFAETEDGLEDDNAKTEDELEDYNYDTMTHQDNNSYENPYQNIQNN